MLALNINLSSRNKYQIVLYYQLLFLFLLLLLLGIIDATQIASYIRT